MNQNKSMVAPAQPVQTPELPKLTFVHLGSERTLNKHPSVQQALRRGEITLEESAAKPWYLRAKVSGSERLFALASADKDALRKAKDILNGAVNSPNDFSAFIAKRDAARGVTIGQLAQEWITAGYPDENGRARKPLSAARTAHELDSALKFWTDKRARAAADHFSDFLNWKRTNARRGDGTRSADMELNVLSCLCLWAVYARKLETNPFAGRPVFHDPDEITHCSDSMPESDEIIHRLLSWFWTPQPHRQLPGGRVSDDTDRIVAGAWLAWCNLTGLRTSEPWYLQRRPALLETPHRPDQLESGTVFPLRDGRRAMKVHRRKHGQNPFITLHAAAEEFLRAWNAWLEVNMPGATQLFPDPANPTQPFVALTMQRGVLQPDTSHINKFLTIGCDALKIPHCTISGFGRAYYVRVRKSQGISNAVIAEELGQTTLGALIRSTYGSAVDYFASGQYDWLPADTQGKATPTAWSLLETKRPANVITL